jgi:glycosyltransferase involved in cell wall biosynthesis
MKISVIVPVFNEEKYIEKCVESLLVQEYPDFEIIIVDDGSTDNTLQILNGFASRQQIILLRQDHLGPAHARNLGNSCAGGEILVFVDADMTFEKKFIEELTAPLNSGKSKGSFSKEEYVANWNNNFARFWQYNRGIYSDRMIDKEYDKEAPVFRAILKSEFEKVHGFDDIGYTDDWSLSRKLGYKSVACLGAKYFHNNPENYTEVWHQAEWIGKNEFISGNILRKLKSSLKFNPICSIINGIRVAIKVKDFDFLSFKIIYDLAIILSIGDTLISNRKIK